MKCATNFTKFLCIAFFCFISSTTLGESGLREWNTDWYSEMLREDTAPKIKMGTANTSDKNISFNIIFDKNSQYTSIVTLKKSDLQSYREFKNNDYIPIQVRIDERFIHE